MGREAQSVGNQSIGIKLTNQIRQINLCVRKCGLALTNLNQTNWSVYLARKGLNFFFKPGIFLSQAFYVVFIGCIMIMITITITVSRNVVIVVFRLRNKPLEIVQIIMSNNVNKVIVKQILTLAFCARI